MDQLSLPFRIALVAVLALVAVWFVALRPKAGAGASAPPVAASHAPARPAAPGVKGLGRAVGKAHAAVAQSDASAAAASAAPAPAARKPAAAVPKLAPAAAPAAARPAAHPAPVKPQPRKSTLLLFAGHGADDAVARSVVRSFAGPRVRTIVAPLARISLYKNLIGAIPITTSPTILVIGPDLQAREITGLPDRAQVQQALAAGRP